MHVLTSKPVIVELLLTEPAFRPHVFVAPTICFHAMMSLRLARLFSGWELMTDVDADCLSSQMIYIFYARSNQLHLR